MLIAKSYYGKKVRSGIQRLAEGKYRIAGKIVFVRVSNFSSFMIALVIITNFLLINDNLSSFSKIDM